MLLLLLACAPVTAPPVDAPEADEAGLQAALELTEPSVALALLDHLMAELPDCEPARFEDGVGLRETWTCPSVAGTVDRYEDEELVWMEVSGLVLEDFQMDGAIELVVEDGVATLELAATFCGEAWSDCEEPIQADMRWTLIDAEAGQQIVLRGTIVTPELGPALVEGNLLLDEDCDQPADGVLVLEGHRVQEFRSSDCDCAAWSVDGEPVGTFCR